MDLHRTHSKPEWLTIPPEQHNYWQRIAARTKGIVTPGNILTMIGLVLSLVGLGALLKEAYWIGLALLATGRLLDIADGLAADKTGTKSPLGELLDVSVDKIITALTLVTFFVAAIAPWPLLAAILLPHLLITICTLYAAANHIRLHPSRTGKVSMALAWVGLIGLLLVHAMPAASGTLAFVVYAVVVTSIATGLYALAGYVREAIR